jgi:alpha-ribazole phosphatase
MKGTIFVARHAPVAESGICYGQSDQPTTLDAAAASAILLERLTTRVIPVSRVWCSPWERARAPAEHVARMLRVPVTVDERLSELSFGDWEGRPYARLEREASFVEWMRDWRAARPPGGERLAELVERVRTWRADALERGGVALAITHAGVIRVLRADARGVGYEEVVNDPVAALVPEPAAFAEVQTR